MANVFIDRIKGIALSKGQQKIAQYFIDHQEQILNMTSMEAARAVGVSDASIIRFARTIGYEGFTDMKKDVYKAVISDVSSMQSLVERQSSSIQKYSDVSSESFQAIAQNNILETFRKNDSSKYEQIADMLIGARKKYVIGMRGCRGPAFSFGRLLSFMLEGVQLITDEQCTSVNLLQDASEDDVVILFAFSRFYKMDLNYLKLARKRNAKICLVTNEINADLTGNADIVLVVSTDHMGFFNSAIGLTAVSEYILTLIGRKAEYAGRLEERDEITEYQRL